MNCDKCGAELAPEQSFCRRCGAPRPEAIREPGARISGRFAEAERRFASLRRRYQAGQLGDAAYEAELRRLVVEDDAGGYWMLGADSGAWYWHDGQRWVPRDPTTSRDRGSVAPVAGEAGRPAQVTPLAPIAGPRRLRWPLWLVVGLPLLCVVVGAVFLVTTNYGAVVRYSLAIALHPEDADVYRSRAAAYGDLGAHERAAADLTRAIELHPGYDEAWWMRAVHYKALGRTEEAISDLDVYLMLDPENCVAYMIRGDLWRRQGNVHRARVDYEQVLALEEEGYWHEDALQALAEMGIEPIAPELQVAPAASAGAESAIAAAVPETAVPPTPSPQPAPTATRTPPLQPTVAAEDREILFYEDFEAAHEPDTGDSGEVRWEGGELRMLVSKPGKSTKTGFKHASATDYRLHVTGQPVRLQPRSMYGVGVRTDPDLATSGGYWFTVAGDGTCEACIVGIDGTLSCPSEWQTCPARPTGANHLVIEVVGSSFSFWVNETLVATFEDATHTSGVVALYVQNDQDTTDTLVAFDDLTLFEP